MESDQLKLERLNKHLEILKDSIKARASFVVFQISGVTAVLIALFSFSDFIPTYPVVSLFTKILLCMFLVLMPVAFFLYLLEINGAANTAQESIENIIGSKLEQPKSTFLNQAMILFPWIFGVILFLTILFIVIVIWL